ncbi:Hypothetical predicted protein [Mytilus galloprovincialis]|uniref:Integrase zinc-binding domain-containing protein n=1 Tax=Mytilus galloprovincialis TaxID=29158 RepID=A0A8B6E323_MYTGA|nr:Hypothetical predicted protein [Mytilus galloprovincialis]
MKGPGWIVDTTKWPQWKKEEALIFTTLTKDNLSTNTNDTATSITVGINKIIDIDRLLHSGLESTVTSLRQFYWIPAVRQYVKTIIHKCVTCRKVTGRPYATPYPPPLPADRLRDSPPFTVTALTLLVH